MTLQDIRNKHPFPWRYVNTGIQMTPRGLSGHIVVLDANQQQVGFGEMFELLVLVTTHMTPQATPAPPAPQETQA